MQSMQRKKVAVETACGQHVNSAASPEDLHQLFVQALNSGDLAIHRMRTRQQAHHNVHLTR